MNLRNDIIEYSSLALAATTIGINLLYLLFYTSIYSSKLKNNIENLLNLLSINWMEIQLLFSLAYLSQSYTEFSLTVLRSNRNWVFFNFFDRFYSDLSGQNFEDFFYTEWSESGTKNVFTVCLSYFCYLICYILLKIFLKHSSLTKFFEFEIGLVLIKITTFRIVLSCFIEIYRLYQGYSPSYNTGVLFFIGSLSLVFVPLFKLIYLRLKYLKNLDSEKPLTYFGSDYRAYKPCCREYQIFSEISCLVISSSSIAFLSSFPKVQTSLILGTLILFSVYSAVVRPFTSLHYNIHLIASRSVLALLAASLTIYQFYSSDSFLDLSVCVLIFLYYSIKLFFVLYEIYFSLLFVKSLLSEGENQIMLKEPTDQKTVIEVTNNDFGAISASRLNEEPETLVRQQTNNSKVRIKRGGTVESSGSDGLDPRLTRKRTSRKRKTVINN